MLKQKPAARILPCAALAMVCGLTMTASALAQGGPKPTAAEPGNMQNAITGTWQCKPNPDPCTWPGASPSITQSGNDLQIKGADGATADARMTSATTISAGGTFNSFGIVRPDKSIDWSDGTKWSKQ
ncbi:MAG TPA: hypothetical protein VHD86_23615 [Xanthobacteraceae bacterium]|nr:hypothetical protein [Xanthobacteraceae bacterium]